MNVTLATLVRACLIRDWQTARTYRLAFAGEVVNMLTTLTMFFYLDRTFVGARPDASAELADGYFSFVAIGLVFLGLVGQGIAGPPGRLRDEQATGSLEALLSTPSNATPLLWAGGAFGLAREIVSGVIVVTAAVFVFGLPLDLTAASAAAILVALTGAVMLATALGMAIAGLTLLVRRTGPLASFTVTAVALSSGVYFPTDVLPDALGDAMVANPFKWAVDLLRDGLLDGRFDLGLAAGLAATGPVALVLATALYEYAVRRAKRRGTLIHV